MGKINSKDTEQAYRTAAEIVAKYGDAYLPIFKRLHNEMQRLNETEEIKSIALKTFLLLIPNALKNSTKNGFASASSL